jgi:hypothetical protein
VYSEKTSMRHLKIDSHCAPKRAWPVKILTALAEAEQHRGGIGHRTSPPLKNISITSQGPQVALDVMVKQIQFLLDMRMPHSVLTASAGKLSL